jgi:hypothetical protein
MPFGAVALIRILTVFVVLICFSSKGAASEQTVPDEILQRAFIWSPSAPADAQTYAVFRKSFVLNEGPRSAVMRLFADSRYVLWMNGAYVDRGPCRFDPVSPEYDTLAVARFLRPGTNVVAVLVHHYQGASGRIMRHAPGLTAALDVTDSGGGRTIRTDATWSVCAKNRFGQSASRWSSIPDNVDARRDTGDWTAEAFDSSSWEKAIEVDGKQWGALRARKIPLLRETEIQPLHVVQQQTGAAAPETLVHHYALAERLPADLGPGDFLVLDAGRFFQAYCVIDGEADAGSRLEVSYADTFFSNGNQPRVPKWIGVSSYIARQGRQTFMSNDTFGGKYVVIRCASGKIRLLNFRLINRLYPFDVVGKFTSDDSLLNDVWQLGVNAIQTCSEDAYVDCSMRERTEWLADAVMIAYPVSRCTMAGPATESDGAPYWSDPRLFGSLLRHIGQSAQPDGRVKAHHPSDRWDIHGYIEDYACLWIQNLRVWHDNTGGLELVREMWPAVTAQLKWFLDRRTARGLVKAREFVYFRNPLIYQVCEGATLNAFVAQALSDAAVLADLLGKTDQQREYRFASESIRQAIDIHLWDGAANAYSGGIKDGTKTPPTVHAAALCLYYDCVPADRRKQVESWFATHIEKEGSFPYQYAFYLEVLARMDSDSADGLALDLIRRQWVAMARGETKTTWEAFPPSECCHEAGGAPTVYLSRHVLGVQVDGPVNKRLLRIEPRLGSLKRAGGTVVTEFGPVPVCWDRAGADGRLRFSVVVPSGVTARVSLPRSSGSLSVPEIDGRAAQRSDQASARFFTLQLGAGVHRGEF